MELNKIYKKLRSGILYLKYSLLKKDFKFQGKRYKYFIRRYNHTWGNERAIEVPLIMEAVLGFKGKKILEFGNVLSHYFSFKHDVLDKYEKGKGVINEDVCSFNSDKKYDLIVSISTLEHVGWNTGEKKDKKKIKKAIENLKKLLSPKGKIISSVPLGYNPSLDD